MAMGDLARLPRPDEAGDSYDVPLDPWQRAALAAQALEQRAPPQPSGPPPNMGSLYGMATAGDIAQAVGKKYGGAIDYYAGLPSRAVSPPPNPYPPASEEAQDWDNMLMDAKRQWGIQTGFGMVFDPLGVKRSVGMGGGSLGSGAGSRIIQPEVPAIIEPAGRTSGIRAYHSSPHDFEKFDFSPARGRTGEGAQTYGEGGYFAENPAVSGQGGQYWEQFKGRFSGPEAEAARQLSLDNFDRAQAIASVDRQMRGYIPGSTLHTQLSEAKRLLESGKPVGPRTYEVKIMAHPDEMLDWDKALMHQDPQVQARLKDVMGRSGFEHFKPADPRTAINNGFISYDRRDASLRMQEAGIPGIRYLDEGSRLQAAKIAFEENNLRRLQQGNPDIAKDVAARVARLKEDPLSSNYVMFPGTEDRVHIMAKYGLAGAVPTMGSLADMSYREQ
jgi:hypothetical protein